MMEKLNIKILFTVAVLLLVAGIWHIWPEGSVEISADIENAKNIEEIEKIKATGNLDEQVKWYTDLIERVGPVEAQEHLYRSGLPFTGETHLLNHTVGDKIYEKFGERGLIYCRDYFLSSCHHGFLIRLIGEGGVEAVADAVEECKVEGRPVYVQCAHAIGHGFLAEAGYKNLTDALSMCSEVKKEVGDFPEFNCHDGVFMENIWAVHEGGEPSPDRWVKEDDAFYPCNDPRIEDKYLRGCWSNQAAIMYRIFEGDIEKIGEECTKVTDKNSRAMCFDGLARQIHPATEGSAEAVFDMCGALPASRQDNCLATVASADFSVGGRELPFNICNEMHRQGRGEECYTELTEKINIYIQDKKERTGLCAKIEDENWRDEC